MNFWKDLFSAGVDTKTVVDPVFCRIHGTVWPMQIKMGDIRTPGPACARCLVDAIGRIGSENLETNFINEHD